MITLNGYRQIARDLSIDASRTLQELREAFEAKQIHASEFSLKALAEHTVEDGREWVASMDPRFGSGTFREAAGAVSTVNFSNITGQLMVNSVLQGYQSEDFVFSGLVEARTSNLSGEKIPGLQKIGDRSEVVAEGQAYPLVGIGEDWIELPPTVKRGMIIPVTKEAIFFDLTGQVVSNAAEIGTYLGLAKEKRIIDCIIDENTTAGRYKWKGTSYATYAASGGHGVVNKKTSNGLVDWSNIDAALLVQSAIVDPFTGEPVVSMGSDLIVTPQLLATARHIVQATSNQRVTPGYDTSANPNVATMNGSPALGIPGYSAASYNIRTSRLLAARLATDTHWFIGDIAKSFCYTTNFPLTVETAAPGSPKEFEQDIVLQYKASERGAAGTKDVRYMIQNTVA